MWCLVFGVWGSWVRGKRCLRIVLDGWMDGWMGIDRACKAGWAPVPDLYRILYSEGPAGLEDLATYSGGTQYTEIELPLCYTLW